MEQKSLTWQRRKKLWLIRTVILFVLLAYGELANFKIIRSPAYVDLAVAGFSVVLILIIFIIDGVLIFCDWRRGKKEAKP